MARQKEFDREQALDQAMREFWARGYASTSTDDLLKAMSISRQSMYDTFGDKRRLYLEALQRYNAGSVGGLLRHLGKGESPLGGIERMLVWFASKSADEHALGCMGINAVCEFGVTDADVNALTETSTLTVMRALEQSLSEARDCGEMSADIVVKEAATFVLSTLAGMKVSAKGGADTKTLGIIASMALRSLRTQGGQAIAPKGSRRKA